jgi:hypothetical protein
MHDDPDPIRSAAEPIRFDAAVGGRSRIPAVLAALAVAFAALVLVLPRLEPGPPSAALPLPSSAPSAPVVAAAPAPTSRGVGGSRARDRAAMSSRPAPTAGVEAICMEPETWRTATIEQWHPDQRVRVWRALDPQPANGPADPSIARVPAVGEAIAAIGYCAPVVGPDEPTSRATVAAWRLDGSVATSIPLRQMAPVGGEATFGALFAPPDARDSSWPTGVYVFRFAELAPNIPGRWFAVDVRSDASAARIPRPPPSAVMQPGGALGAFFLP